ncbi:hypothetical protein BJY24_001724 [Nocardia transvalensis]|uniref:Outer membrane channel protein CpnT-like N-terminal domain-containing protein n=1 Tax=Nocardia transvalensis TaxID=37333 RepID=A0A7W9UH82_9NOCA|nr:hypothetical protein [Nocardia transvalensis]MBB5912857.1 hypothetical protein [Nocardia transvalensis]
MGLDDIDITVLWEWIPDWILTALNFGSKYPDGRHMDGFDLRDGWRRHADELDRLEQDLRSVTDETFKWYEDGEGADKIKEQFDALFAADSKTSFPALVENMKGMGKYAGTGGTTIEGTKMLDAVFAGITARMVFALLPEWPWGTASVPLVLATGRVAIGQAFAKGVERAGLEAAEGALKKFLENYVKKVTIENAATPLLRWAGESAAKQAAVRAGVAGVDMAVKGAALDAGIQGVQMALGHREEYDWRQTAHTGIMWGVGGLVGAPIGMAGENLVRNLPSRFATVANMGVHAIGGAAGMYAGGITDQVATQVYRNVRYGQSIDLGKVNYRPDWHMVGAGAAMGALGGANRPKYSTDLQLSPGAAAGDGSIPRPMPSAAQEAAAKVQVDQVGRRLIIDSHPDRVMDPGAKARNTEIFQRAQELKDAPVAYRQDGAGNHVRTPEGQRIPMTQTERLAEMRGLEQRLNGAPASTTASPGAATGEGAHPANARPAPAGEQRAAPVGEQRAAPAGEPRTGAARGETRAGAAVSERPGHGSNLAAEARNEPVARVAEPAGAESETHAVPERRGGVAPEERPGGVVPEQRPGGLAPEQRAAGVAPEQRAAGVAPEQRAGIAGPERSVPQRDSAGDAGQPRGDVMAEKGDHDGAGRSEPDHAAVRYDSELANGQGIVYRENSTSIGEDGETHRVRDNVRNEGEHDVVVHGSRDGAPIPGRGHEVHPEQIVEAIRNNPHYREGTPIRLLACHSGNEVGWAQYIADRLGVPVRAPTDSVGTPRKTDSPAIIRDNGRWETFEPRRAEEALPADRPENAPAPRADSPAGQRRSAFDDPPGWDFMDEPSRPESGEGRRSPFEQALKYEEPPPLRPRPWPVDPASGYVIRDRDLDFLGLNREQVEWWMSGEAVLGMDPRTYRVWRFELLEALAKDGVPLDQVDIRVHGSGVNFFSSGGKKLLTEEELAGHPEALERMREWLGDDPERPTGRPFDSMYRLGLDLRSDFDLNISSGPMFERAAGKWDPEKFGGSLTKDHGYLNKRLAHSEFPHLHRWAADWGARTGREMSLAIFDAHGPVDVRHLGVFKDSLVFSESDWIVHRPPGDATPPSPDHDGSPQPDETPPAPDPTLYDWMGAEEYTLAEFDTALTERALEVARENGTTPEAEIMQFVLQRAVVRVFAEHPDAWILKGGESFLARFPDGRATTDLDLIRITEGDTARMEADYNAALSRDHGDHLRFEWLRNESIAGGRGIRVFHQVYLGSREPMELGIDLVPNREIDGYPSDTTHWVGETHAFPARQLFRFEGVGDPSHIRILSLEGFVRQKVAAMYTHDRDGGQPPQRCNDLVDLTLVALKTSWDGPRAHAMLREEFELRWSQGEQLYPPDRFANPNPEWGPKYADYARVTPGLPFTTLGEALPLLGKFLDPLLKPDPPQADWDHRTLNWVPRDGAGPTVGTPPEPRDPPGIVVAPLTEGIPAEPGAIHPAEVKLIPTPGDNPPSTAFAEPERIPQWDRLSGSADSVGSVPSIVDGVMNDPSVPELADKLAAIRDGLLPESAGAPSPVQNWDSKNLRFYSFQAGELFIHSAAAMTDPAITIEVGYLPDRVVDAYAREAEATHVSYTGELPDGMTRKQADAVALWRMLKGRPVVDVAPAELVRDLLDMHAQPLVDALAMRRNIIHEYGIAPERVRLAYGDDMRLTQTAEHQHMRAHIRALGALRDDPEAARAAMVRGMSGADPEARWERARGVVDRLDAAARELGVPAEKIALLWVRDQRANPTANRNGLDTQPGVLRQLIEETRAADPERHVVLVGDDIFHNRTGLREAWAADGVLDGVDTTTMVKFWDKARNGGTPLGPGEQGLVFHQLLADRDIIQIGTESGALEIPFLLGVPTVYLENQVFHLNKGNRWTLISQEWRYGHFETVCYPDGTVELDESGHPVREFHQVGETLPPPLRTVARVQFGPDLAVPKDRQAMPSDFPHQRVALTADRVYRLVETGELDRWAHRLGYTAPDGAGERVAWTTEQWARSRYYADQLHSWLHTEATPDTATRKWDAIRLALRGVVDPGFEADPEIPNRTLVHPYYVLQTDHPVPAAEHDRLAHAYGAPIAERPAAVAAALRTLLSDPGLRSRAVRDELLSQLDEAELAALRRSAAGVLDASRGSADPGPGDAG